MNKKRQKWEALGRERVGSVAELLREGEMVDDHGLMRLRGKRRWHEGFMVITDRRLIFVPDNSNQVLSVLFSGVENYRGLTKIMTADLFIDIDGRRLRFNGAKTFVNQCCRQLGRFAGAAELSPYPSASRPDRVRELQERYAYLNAEMAPLLAEATQMNQIEAELAKLGAEPDEELNQRIKRETGTPDTPFNT